VIELSNWYGVGYDEERRLGLDEDRGMEMRRESSGLQVEI
jgi:hypothetical protein